MKRKIVVVCGVSGMGKTWVCQKVSHRFTYVPHDNYINDDLVERLVEHKGNGPFITECPFAERILKDRLEKSGFEVLPYFIFETPEIMIARRKMRGSRPPSKAMMTRALTIKNRIDQWKAPSGTSWEVGQMLRELNLGGF